ncbi:MAG: hypothetical protein OHK0038_07230 [Flammeovirgaceae bacterium]
MKLLALILFFLNIILGLKAQENQYVPNEWDMQNAQYENDAKKLRAWALAYIQNNQHQKARILLDKIITDNQGIAEDFYFRGQCNERLNNELVALNDYRNASKLNIFYPEALFAEANLLFSMERFAEVIPLIDRLLLDTLSELTETKVFLFGVSNLGVDVSSFRTLNQKQSSYKALLYFFKAQSYFMLNQPERALVEIEKAIGYQSENEDAWILKGLIFKKMNQIKDAKNCFEFVLKINRNNSKSFYELSLIISDKDAAQESINKALENEPFVEGYWQRGVLKFEEKNYGGAISDFDSVLMLQPLHYEALLNRGLCFSQLKNYQNALNDFKKVIAIEPENPKGYTCKANVYMKTKEYLRAIEAYKISLNIDSLQANVLFNMGVAYQGLKNIEKACEFWQKAAHLGSQQAKEVILKKCQE